MSKSYVDKLVSEACISNDKLDQLKKYASDLSSVYKSEKLKRKELIEANQQLVRYANDLCKSVSELKQTHENLNAAYLDTIHRLVLAAEYKDEDTGDHIMRMSKYCALIAERSGYSEKGVQDMRYASSMHDIGKVGIPDIIMTKPGKLSDEEFTKIKEHTIIGKKILADSNADVLIMAESIAASHHEKWNGSGYPYGLMGEDIPSAGRIVAIADVFDALTSRRPYKDPYPIDVTIDIIKKERGESFEPKLVDIFLENLYRILKIKEEVSGIYDISYDDFVLSERDNANIV